MDEDNNRCSEVTPYVDPTSIIVKDHPKALSNDYEALPTLSEYETPKPQMSDTPYQYEVASNTLRDSIREESKVSEALPDDEQIYEDPGHNKEKIYSCFENKKFRKIKRSDIKYVAIAAYNMFLF